MWELAPKRHVSHKKEAAFIKAAPIRPDQNPENDDYFTGNCSKPDAKSIRYGKHGTVLLTAQRASTLFPRISNPLTGSLYLWISMAVFLA